MRRPFVNQLNVAVLLQLRVVTIHINGVTRPEKVNFQKSITYIMRLKLLYISPLPPAVAFLTGQWVYHPPPSQKLQGFGVFTYLLLYLHQ